MTKKTDQKYAKLDSVASNLSEAMKHYRVVQEKALVQGIFLYDRELLNCSQCNLAEDIDHVGRLFTYRRGDNEFKTTGLQFIALDDKNERFKCPSCGAECLAPLEPPLHD